MALFLDLENIANWTIRDSQFFTASSGNLLPEYLSVDIASNIISVLVANSEALSTWNFAGWLSQQVQLPFGPSSSSAVSYRRLWLRQKQLLVFPYLTFTYKVAIRFPKWFDRASITIWEYTGMKPEATEIQLQQIQAKLDLLLQRPP